MADESTDEAKRTQFAIIVKFLRKGKIEDVFLGLIHVTSATAENLMDAIERFLMAKGIPIEKAILVGFDGCNTMSGENKGKYKKFNWDINSCYNKIFTKTDQ
ncbi:hypothetical protein DPMN_017149 [Dreissena polymorpha]|uniref:DUF4371 domain-containing protein n=1 Tax=Dreissena polymorpha TaxID=45954 RepID=A0A9D4S647_DREPO|nr:hypothetical protein DPMN_017149 [Dreissena polymorpha]